MVPRRLYRWLAERPGPVGASAAAYRGWRWGDPELRLLRELCDRHRTSVDVGANAGLYTWFLRRYSRHCIAFEPNPQLAACLRRRFPNGVDIRNQALSNNAGLAILRIPIAADMPDPGRATIEAANRLPNATGGIDTIEVDVVTLDQAVHEPIGFIKIDVEGHELKVLQGAERILREDRPNLLLELEDRHNPGIVSAVFAHLGVRGYFGWFLEAGKPTPISAFNPERHQNFESSPRWVNNFVFSADVATGSRLHV